VIPVAELKVRLGIETDEHDALLALLEESAVAYVENQTDRYFGLPDNVTEYLEGRGGSLLSLRARPVSGPATVIERAYLGATDVTITGSASDGYAVRPGTRAARLLRKAALVWTDGYEYEATYMHGYAAGQEPKDIRQLVASIVGKLFAASESGGGLLQGETIGGYSYRSGTTAGADIGAMLDEQDLSTLALWTRLAYA
jgi:hypothetical protein